MTQFTQFSLGKFGLKVLLRVFFFTFNNSAAPPPIGHKDATICIRFLASINPRYLNLTSNLCSDCLSYPLLTRPAIPSTPRGEQTFVFTTLTIDLYPPGGFGLTHQRGRVLQGSDAAPGLPPLDCPTPLIFCFVFLYWLVIIRHIFCQPTGGGGRDVHGVCSRCFTRWPGASPTFSFLPENNLMTTCDNCQLWASGACSVLATAAV